MKKSRYILPLIILMLLPISALADPAAYAYDITDQIPLSIQEEILEAFTGPDGLINSPAPANAVSSILEQYLNAFGILPPIDKSVAIHSWVQEALSNLGRTVEVPLRYSSQRDIVRWLERYAAKGDLLLYKANSLPDRVLVYAGSGKYIGRRNGVYTLLDVPVTFVESDGKRTPSSGLYAIGQLWSDPDNSTHKLRFVLKEQSEGFTGVPLQLLVPNPQTGSYLPSPDYVLFETLPGVYGIWNGKSEELSSQILSEEELRSFRITVPNSSANHLPWQVSYHLDRSAPFFAEDDIYLLLPSAEHRNPYPCYGRTLLNDLKGSIGGGDSTDRNS